jgi:hypothetical protein
MQFLPITLKYDPERNSGTVELIEAGDDGEGGIWPIGDTSVSFSLSKEACGQIAAILLAERDRVLADIKSDD